MHVTLVSLLPTEQATQAQRPALTPELLAASGGRYSRNNEGLQAILTKIDPENMDRSVDTIFRLIDYGHQSIADMVPIAIFIDNISIWLAYYVWSLCPTAGGQESSTRYIKLDPESLIAADKLGIPSDRADEWQAQMDEAFAAYGQALNHWERIGDAHPTLTAIPDDLLNDSSEKAAKAADRMKRNYRFDRARYYLPVSAATNMMMVMSARGWSRLCQILNSHPLPEARQLGEALRQEMALSSPRLLKHAGYREGIAAGIQEEFNRLSRKAQQQGLPATLKADAKDCAEAPDVTLDIHPPSDWADGQFAADLASHDNRYGWIGSQLQRTSVRCFWQAIALAELRDMNRHRTGNKYCPMLPVGFYAALEQLPSHATPTSQQDAQALRQLTGIGRRLSAAAFELQVCGDPTAVYTTLLGTQFAFERVLSADKFIYEAELRTGLGAHFRYAKHYKDALALWYSRYPETRGLILEGNAEPE